MKPNGRPDEHVSGVVAVYRALRRYVDDHPRAEVGVFPRGTGLLSVRVLDPDFEGVSWKDRSDSIWAALDAAPDEVIGRIEVLLLMTPREAAEAYIGVADFGAETDGPVRLLANTDVFRDDVGGQDVFVTVGRCCDEDGRLCDGFDASFKFGSPPGILAADEYGLGVDRGEFLRDAGGFPCRFETADAAKAAALAAAGERLARLAAA